MEYYSTQYWKRGKRKKNEDSLCLEEVQTKRGSLLFACVCDGIGGLDAGETASGYVTETLAVWFHEKGIHAFHYGGMKYLAYRMKGELAKVNEQLFQFGKQEGIRLGTTLCLVVLWKHQMFWMQAGDSRIFRIRHRLKQVSVDDRNGRNELTRAIGVMDSVEVRQGFVPVKNGDRFLLCSDGFYGKLTGEELYRAFGFPIWKWERRRREESKQRNWNRVLEELDRQAVGRGETDNSSGILICCERGGR